MKNGLILRKKANETITKRIEQLLSDWSENKEKIKQATFAEDYRLTTKLIQDNYRIVAKIEECRKITDLLEETESI